VSIFAHEVQATATVPQDPPHTFTFRKLTGRELEKAQGDHLVAFMGGHSPRLWAGSLRRILEHGTAANDASVRDALADPLLGFDRYSIVKAGLVSWSYSQNGDKPKAEQIDDLDDEAVDLMARAILKLSKPALFMTAEEREDAKKNGSGDFMKPLMETAPSHSPIS